MNAGGIDFVSIRHHFDTITPTSRIMFGMLDLFAEFERDITQQIDLDASRKRGRLSGYPAIDADTKCRIIKLFEILESAADIAKEYGIGQNTIYKVLKEKEI